MSVLPFSNVFACLAHWVEACCSDEHLCLHHGRCAEATAGSCLPLSALRAVMQQEDLDGVLRTALWQALARNLERETERGQEQRWTLIALWLLTPRLKGAARAIVGRTGAELGDVFSAVLAGAAEGAATAGAVNPDQIEQHLMDSAFAAGWKTGRRAPNEVLAAEVEDGPPVPFFPEIAPTFIDGQVVQASTMSMALVQQAHGERLGALAQGLGLMRHVREVRRLRRAGLVSSERPGTGTAMQQQQALFETGEDTDGTASR
ncbi:hypothetical protein AB0B50_13100 [Streptomyces sp. NPDC041068]|uniref:hypothetical protein n=1 Tax=Streptomyces sp. NPDC041068 TaxID=3155130 RepID=UPI0034028942